MSRTLSLDGAEDVLALATDALASGALIIYPTDTLYALGCRASDGAAALRLRAAKGRDAGKPLPLVAADAAQVEGLCGVLSGDAALLGRRFWPGPLTLVLPVKSGVAPEVTGDASSVAIRVPAHAFVRQLCARAGPLVSTSANRSGGPAPCSCADAVSQLGFAASLAVDGGTAGQAASTIVDVTGTLPRLVRPGATPWSEVEATLRGPRA